MFALGSMGVNAQMKIIYPKPIKYSIEVLSHYICTECGNTFTISLDTEFGVPVLPDRITCPRCKFEFTQFEDETPDSLNFCTKHEIWHYTDLCPICESEKPNVSRMTITEL